MTTPTEFRTPLSARDARWVIEQACLAPSIFNTQPWLFGWDGRRFELYADTSRALTATDPDGRELVISCGAALFNLRLAARKLGYDPAVVLLPERDNPRLLARVDIVEASPANADERRAYAALTRRHTHRGGFDDQPLSPELAVELQRAAELEGSSLVYLSDPGQRRHVLTLARAAERALVNDPEVQAEIEAWTPPPRSLRRDGVPASSYPADPVAQADDIPPRDFDQGRRLGISDAVVRAPGVIAVLVTPGDLQEDWMRGGQALERLLVVAAQHGAYAALHSQLTEVTHLRGELRRELCVSGYPQMLLRFGYAPDMQKTPRRPVDEVLVR